MTVTTGRHVVAIWKDFVGIAQVMRSFLCGLIQAEPPSSITESASVKPKVLQRMSYSLIADSERFSLFAVEVVRFLCNFTHTNLLLFGLVTVPKDGPEDHRTQPA